MRAQQLESSTPLVLALADEPDRLGYEEAVHLAELAQESYDPVTQTSNIPVFSGTNATVCHKVTGMGVRATSDYPTDDA
jgi:hypothetical protein